MDGNLELEAFKTRINLSEYAAAQGFALDRKASSRNSAIMKEPGGAKIVIARNHNQHWIYFTVGDERDSGSIIDFIQNREGGSLGDIRLILRPWLQAPQARPGYRHRGPDLFAASLEPLSKDLAQMRSRFAACKEVPGHPYLEGRGLPASLLSSSTLAGRVLIDGRGNAIFPHYGLEGLTGFEIKNKDFTGFAPGGTKGLWGSRPCPADKRLVICETAIDALSFAALHGIEDTRLVSTGGELNPKQPELLARAMKKLPGGGKIVIAVDNDEGGDILLEKIQVILFTQELRQGVLRIFRPEGRGDDWNDVLRASTL